MNKTNTYCPNISIITVVYNAEQYLEQTILSVISQPYPNIDYIIIDGGSSDNTINIIKSYEKYLYQWITEPDEGIYDAMNKGWSLAKSNSFILFLGSGDQILSLPKINELLSPGVVIYGTVKIGDNLFKSTVSLNIKRRNTLHHQALLVHKSHSYEPPFNPLYKVYGDYDFNARLYKRRVKFKYSPSLKSYALPNGISSSVDFDEMSTIIKKNFGIFWMIFYRVSYRVSRIKKFLTNPIQKL